MKAGLLEWMFIASAGDFALVEIEQLLDCLTQERRA
jgi:hypothetical protein